MWVQWSSASLRRGHSHTRIPVSHFKGRGYTLTHHSLLDLLSSLCICVNKVLYCPDLYTHKAKSLQAPINKQSFLELAEHRASPFTTHPAPGFIPSPTQAIHLRHSFSCWNTNKHCFLQNLITISKACIVCYNSTQSEATKTISFKMFLINYYVRPMTSK